jgi:hypothetical protein
MPAPDILPLAPTLGPSPGQGVGSLSPGWGTGWGQPGRRSLGCRLLLAFRVSMEPLVGINALVVARSNAIHFGRIHRPCTKKGG